MGACRWASTRWAVAGLVAQNGWLAHLTLGVAYELNWTANLDMEASPGPLVGRVY